MDLFGEFYPLKTLVDDARRDILNEVPFRPDLETKEEYSQMIFWLVNEEIARRRLVMGCKNPDYTGENVTFKVKR